MRFKRDIIVLILAAFTAGVCFAGGVVNFEDKTLIAESYWNGSDMAGGFYSGPVWFENEFTDWGWGFYSWTGFGYSNMTDTVTEGYDNQYSCIAGSGAGSSVNYAVVYCNDWTTAYMNFNTELLVNSVSVTNSTYSYLSMLIGDAFAKKFGGIDGTDPDWLMLSINGYDETGAATGTVEFYLADFRDVNPANDYIVSTWQTVDLSSLGYVKKISFNFYSSDVGDWGINTPTYFALDNISIAYAPQAGAIGSKAIHKDSTAFAAWATGATVERGPQDISNLSLGLASFGTPHDAIGKASGVSTSVVSLGDGGVATLTFANPIANGPGADFAVFENGVTDGFLELGFVEVSSDGENFFRFPAVSLTQIVTQVGGFGNTDPTSIYNFAGKYRIAYGTPFDLEELKGTLGLDINNVTHVRVIDVVGCILDDYATYDYFGSKVNDPWPTPFIFDGAGGTSGFDLDGVGVLNERPFTGDMNFDGSVTVDDMMYMAVSWLSGSDDADWNSLCDINSDGIVNYLDMSAFAGILR